MAVAIGAVANGGYLMKPLIVRAVEDDTGRTVRSSRPVAVRRVIDAETVDTLTSLLKGVVTYGTGRHAAIPGYSVAGKTGTAQKIDAQGRYSMADHVASFVGFVPASRPSLVVLVSLDTPRGTRNEGGDVAAPVFARVAEAALRRLAIPPDDPDRLLRMTPFEPARVTTAGYTPPGQPANPAPAEARASAGVDPRLMPDLRGQSAREGAIAAARLGLIVELQGSGRISAQSPEPGTEIETGTRCVLALDRTP
jgi:cell division protein FtsI (penicillin-binding protein 3)